MEFKRNTESTAHNLVGKLLRRFQSKVTGNGSLSAGNLLVASCRRNTLLFLAVRNINRYLGFVSSALAGYFGKLCSANRIELKAYYILTVVIAGFCLYDVVAGHEHVTGSIAIIYSKRKLCRFTENLEDCRGIFYIGYFYSYACRTLTNYRRFGITFIYEQRLNAGNGTVHSFVEIACIVV